AVRVAADVDRVRPAVLQAHRFSEKVENQVATRDGDRWGAAGAVLVIPDELDGASATRVLSRGNDQVRKGFENVGPEGTDEGPLLARGTPARIRPGGRELGKVCPAGSLDCGSCRTFADGLRIDQELDFSRDGWALDDITAAGRP